MQRTAGSRQAAADGQDSGKVTPGYQEMARAWRAALPNQQVDQTAERLPLLVHHKSLMNVFFRIF